MYVSLRTEVSLSYQGDNYRLRRIYAWLKVALYYRIIYTDALMFQKHFNVVGQMS